MRSPGRRMVVAALAPLLAISFATRARSFTEAGSLDEIDVCSLAASGRLGEMRWPDFSGYRDRVESFYRRDACAPAWIAGGQPTGQALAWISTTPIHLRFGALLWSGPVGL